MCVTQEAVEELEESLEVVRRQLAVVEADLQDVRNVSADIAIVHDIRGRMEEYADVFREARNLSLWHPSLALVTSGASGRASHMALLIPPFLGLYAMD